MKTLSVFLAVLLLSACSNESQPASTELSPAIAPKTITVTTKSPEALAHVQKGEALLNNLRTVEASEAFNQALKLDPDFALARAYLGQATPGPDGLKELETAAAAAKNAPEAERTLIEALASNRRGDFAQGTASLKRVIELAPDDWRGHYALGQQMFVVQKYGDAAESLRRAVALNANAGGAQNMLGYAALRQRDTDGAISAFTEYARILPQEPNPQDSLGEALLAAGRFKEAEAAFQKALELSPKFWNAHEGIAYAKFYAGDWNGGRDALAKAKTAATRRVDRIGLDTEAAAAAFAQGNTAEALRMLDAAEKTEGAQPSEVAFIPVLRARALVAAGRTREALAPVAVALKAADSGTFPPGLSRNLRREALKTRIAAEAALKDAAAATKTAAALDEEAKARPDDPNAQSAMHYGQGQLALAKGDSAGASAHFNQCSVEDQLCGGAAVTTAEKRGDKAAATAASERLFKMYERDPLHLFLRSQLSAGTMKKAS